MAVSVNWGPFVDVLVLQEPYYLGSVLGALDFLKFPDFLAMLLTLFWCQQPPNAQNNSRSTRLCRLATSDATRTAEKLLIAVILQRSYQGCMKLPTKASPKKRKACKHAKPQHGPLIWNPCIPTLRVGPCLESHPNKEETGKGPNWGPILKTN